MAEEIRQIRELEKHELTHQFSEQLRMTKEQLRAVISNDQSQIKELGIAKGVLKWLETGDFRFVQPYVEYIFGKPVLQVEAIQVQFIFDFVGRVTDVLDKTMPDACPHCKKPLTLRENTLQQLEILSKAIDIEEKKYA